MQTLLRPPPPPPLSHDALPPPHSHTPSVTMHCPPPPTHPLSHNALTPPTLRFRELMSKSCLYPPPCRYWDDMELMSKISAKLRAANLGSDSPAAEEARIAAGGKGRQVGLQCILLVMIL